MGQLFRSGRNPLSMGGTSAPVPTRVCPHCRTATRVEWPLCDACARSLVAYRPLPDMRLAAELERWDRANPRPIDGAALTRRTVWSLWALVVVFGVLDLRFGRRIGPIDSVWDDLAVGSLIVALAASLVAIVLLAFLSGRDPAPAWRRERAHIRRRLGIRPPVEP
jgi:hypothetical protein